MKIKIVEVGPRDGLQNEKEVLSLEQRRKFIDLLVQAGHTNIEVGSFVRKDKVPQMHGTGELYGQLKKLLKEKPNLNFSALVPNATGYAEALKWGVNSIVVFTAASETFNKKNTNASIKESIKRFLEFVPQALKNKIKVRGYISTCFGCPYEGSVPEKKVLEVANSLLEMGIREISIGDTIGVANPKQVKSLSQKLLKVGGAKAIAMHFHDTRGTALANVLQSLESGIQIFDSSSAGLGGCPYAPGASGNLATEDLLYMLHGMGHKTGIRLDKNVQASRYMESCLGRKLPSRYLQATTPAN